MWAYVSYGDDDPAGRWLPENVHELEALANRVLGPAIEYDSTHGSDLVITLQTWMEHNRRSDEAAAALHIHSNTLAYRLRRFADIIGRDLTTTNDLAEIWLALLARRHIGEPT
jgi:purine catabolism regulator